MRHDSKYSQSHLSAVRQRPDGSYVMGQQHNQEYHRKHFHRDNEDYNNNNNNYYRNNKERTRGSHSNSDLNFQNGERVSSSSSGSSSSDNEGVVSALSVTHESEKQWIWFEGELAKSIKNKETVSSQIFIIGSFIALFTWKMSIHPLLVIRKQCNMESKIYSSALREPEFRHCLSFEWPNGIWDVQYIHSRILKI